MPIQLEPVDVVVVGLGAAGGVAVLPLARAGKNHRRHRSRHLDGPCKGLPRRRDLQQRPRPRHHRHQSLSRDSHRPHKCHAACAPSRISSNDERHRRHVDSLPRAELAFQSLDFQVRSRTIARYGISAMPAGSTVEDWPLTYADLEPFYDIVRKRSRCLRPRGQSERKNLPAKAVPSKVRVKTSIRCRRFATPVSPT